VVGVLAEGGNGADADDDNEGQHDRVFHGRRPVFIPTKGLDKAFQVIPHDCAHPFSVPRSVVSGGCRGAHRRRVKSSPAQQRIALKSNTRSTSGNGMVGRKEGRFSRAMQSTTARSVACVYRSGARSLQTSSLQPIE